MKKKKRGSPLIILLAVIIFVFLLAEETTILKPFIIAFFEYIDIIWWAIGIGIVAGAFVEYAIPQNDLKKYLHQKGIGVIFASSILGFIMSASEEKNIDIGIELYKKGARTSSVVAFLLAAPWASLSAVIILFAFFGYMSFAIIGGAVLISIITGLIFYLLENKKLVELNFRKMKNDKITGIKNLKMHYLSEEDFLKSIWSDLKNISKISYNLSKDLLFWVLISISIAAVVRAYLPPHIMSTYMGATIMGLFITFIVAVIIEIVSEGAIPLPFEIFRQTGALGNSFVFIQMGVVGDYIDLRKIWREIGKKTVLWLIIVGIPQILFLGWIFNSYL